MGLGTYLGGERVRHDVLDRANHFHFLGGVRAGTLSHTQLSETAEKETYLGFRWHRMGLSLSWS